MARRINGEFQIRNSLLTILAENPHLACLRNGFITYVIMMIAHRISNDLFQFGRVNWTFDLLQSTVGQIPMVIFLWTTMLISSSFLVFHCTALWLQYRNSFPISKLVGAIIYVSYLTLFITIPLWQIMRYRFPVVSSSIVIAEQLRFLMKTHSFIRERIKKSDEKKTKTTFGCYLYFLFAPTLIYRDEYPRTPAIQWLKVTNFLGQFLVMLILNYHVIAYGWMPVFDEILRSKSLTREKTASIIWSLMWPGVLVIIFGFYGLMHCWLNLFAELLRFGDRHFYEDWWNMTSANTFWRSWNVVVHDWLHIYIYQDCRKLLHFNRTFSIMSVVLVSAICHEYFIFAAVGLISPIVLIWFVAFGIIFRFSNPTAEGAFWNIFLLMFMPLCSGFVPYFYAIELATRKLNVESFSPESISLHRDL